MTRPPTGRPLPFDFDLGDLGVVARDALERAQIVVRFSRGLDPRERCRCAAFVATRSRQDHLVDWEWF
jgi:hypothetical protein